MKERYAHIDLLESIAIFFVIIYHSRLYSSDIGNDTTLFKYLEYFFNTVLSTCVPLFFFVNGYLLFSKDINLKKHTLKIIRFIFITIVWSVFYLLFFLIIKGEPFSIRTIVFGVLNMNIKHGLNIMWFMGAMVCIYILYPALKSLFDLNRKAFVWFAIICAIFTFGIVAGQQISDISTVLLNHRVSIVNHDLVKMFNPFKGIYGYSIVYFCFGGLIHTFEGKIRAITRLKRNTISAIGLFLSSGLLFLLGLFYTSFNNSTWDVVWYGYDTIFTFANVFFIYVLSLNYEKNYQMVKNISCNTLGIYFIHNIIVIYTKPLLNISIFGNIPSTVCYALIVLAISLVISILIKRIPIIKHLV